LGGHIDGCDTCGNISISYNSCQIESHKCQGETEDWIQARQSELLPLPYFHVVLPCPMHQCFSMQDLRLVYDLLFGVGLGNFEKFGKAKRNQTGMIAVLHTGQNLPPSALTLHHTGRRC
jgi:hypothetical protein